MIRKGMLVILTFVLVAKFCHKQTEGFALTKVSHQLLAEPDDPITLDMTYRYLAKGGQAYAFVSEDGHTVLKLFRSSRLNTLEQALNIAPLPPLKKRLEKERKKCEKTLQSYRLAYTKLKTQTGLIAVHLGQNTPIKGTCKIIDKLGICHIIDLQTTPFVIQKRAVLVKEALNDRLATQGVEGAKEALYSLLEMIKERHQLGIADHDPNLAKNFGFIGLCPIEIDAGRFELGPKPTLDRLDHSKEDLQHWINAHHPELSAPFDTLYREIIGDPL